MALRKHKKHPVASDPLSDFEEKMVSEYFVDFSPYRAYFRAGFNGTKRSAIAEASKAFNSPHVKRAMEERRKQMRERMAITAENVLAEYAKIAYANVDDATIRDDRTGKVKSVDISRLTRDQLASISSIENVGSAKNPRFKIRYHDKKGALDKLGVHLRLFKDDEVPTFTTVNFIIERGDKVRKAEAAKAAAPKETKRGK